MEKSDKIDATSSAIEVIENDDITQTEAIQCVDDIEEKIRQKYIQKTFTDNHNNATQEINEITRAVRGLEMVKNKSVVCDCNYCCCWSRHLDYDKMKNYVILFLKDMMIHESEKFKQISQFITNLEEFPTSVTTN